MKNTKKVDKIVDIFFELINERELTMGRQLIQSDLEELTTVKEYKQLKENIDPYITKYNEKRDAMASGFDEKDDDAIRDVAMMIEGELSVFLNTKELEVDNSLREEDYLTTIFGEPYDYLIKQIIKVLEEEDEEGDSKEYKGLIWE